MFEWVDWIPSSSVGCCSSMFSVVGHVLHWKQICLFLPIPWNAVVLLLLPPRHLSWTLQLLFPVLRRWNEFIWIWWNYSTILIHCVSVGLRLRLLLRLVVVLERRVPVVWQNISLRCAMLVVNVPSMVVVFISLLFVHDFKVFRDNFSPLIIPVCPSPQPCRTTKAKKMSTLIKKKGQWLSN